MSSEMEDANQVIRYLMDLIAHSVQKTDQLTAERDMAYRCIGRMLGHQNTDSNDYEREAGRLHVKRCMVRE